MIKQQLTLDGASYCICLPDAEMDYMQRKIAQDKKPYEIEMLRDIAARLQPGDLVLDVGANIGNHTLYLASVAGCRVHAIEQDVNFRSAIQLSVAESNMQDLVVVSSVFPSLEFSKNIAVLLVNSVAIDLFKDIDFLRTFNFGECYVYVSIDVLFKLPELKEAMLANNCRGRAVGGYLAFFPENYLEIIEGGLFPFVSAKFTREAASDIAAQAAGVTCSQGFSSVADLGDKQADVELKTKQHDFFCQELIDNSALEKDKVGLFLGKEPALSLSMAERWNIEKAYFEHALKFFGEKLASVQNELSVANVELARRTEQLHQANERYKVVTAQQIPKLKEKLEIKTAQAAELLKRLRQQEEATTKECEQLVAEISTSKDDLHRVGGEYALLLSEHSKVRHDPHSKHLELDEHISAVPRPTTEELTLQLQQHIADSQAQVNSLQHALQAQAQQLDSANQKYRQASGQAIPRLQEKLDAQVERTRELQQRVDVLNRELKQARVEKATVQRALTAMRKSLTYKAGLQVRAASGSFKDALKLPIRLWRLRKQADVNHGLTVDDISGPAVAMLPASTEADHARLITSHLAQKPARQIRMACIMDDFTHGSYAPECDLFQLTPQHWRNELEAFQPEVLFIESAWRGKDELWGSKVGHCSQELQGIVAWCREQQIPTLFWNKEDPVHFETFLTTAQLFDFVFTTDMDCIHRYKAALGHEHVYFLPFACQPAVHNPIEKYVRKDAFCFAGAYYLRYPERTRDLESLVRELPAYRPLDIYDRNHGKNDPNYQFPAQYRPHIVGTLPFSEIDKAYKGYRFAINLNSIKQSQTMFARRVYELLGSNTLTISNYSRGVRLMFGDLVVTSDSGADIVRRLQQLEDNYQVDKLRLAGLRKVMSEHTYADRMSYLLEKITGQSRARQLQTFTVVAKAANQVEASAIVAAVARQQGVQVQLLLVCGERLPVAEGNQLMKQAQLSGHALQQKTLRNEKLLPLASEQDWLAAMLACDYYGPHYLLDMALATRYSNAQVLGKAAYFSARGQAAAQRHNADQAYQSGLALAARRAVIHPQLAAKLDLNDWLNNLEHWVYQAPDQQAIDCYNYCQDVGLQVEATLVEQVNDAPVAIGASLAELVRMAEAIAPMQSDLEHAPWLDGAQFAHLLSGQAFTWLNGRGLPVSKHEERSVFLTRNQAISCRLMGPVLEVESKLPDGKHDYLYAKKDYELQSLQALLASSGIGDCANGLPLHLQIDPGLNLSLVVLYLDADKRRLGHEVLQANRNLMALPLEGTHYLRFGLRVYAGGSCKIHRLAVGHLDLEPASILGQSDVLLLTNHYPSYDDLYRNGFVHSRVKAYREHNANVDVFRLRKDRPISWHEFENVDVITGSQNALRRMLASERYRHVLVHFLDADMWYVLKDFIDTIKVTVWVHGAEIHPWYRRKFNIETPGQEEIEKAKSEIRISFWRKVLNHMPANLHVVFVSRTFSQEVMEDLGLKLPEQQYSIIHNPISTQLFCYQEKPAEQRKKILSIRPFSSRQYANDISVRVIQELAKYEFFKELDIRIIGDGKLFDETVAPIRDYPNVTLERRFVTRGEIATLHKEYGIFLCPTRWDSQGVSRDEAMSSGLVVATTAIAAIPEFADETCAILAPPENAIQLAQGIAALQSDENCFKQRSLAATGRVMQQTSEKVILEQELNVFVDMEAMNV